MPECGFCSQEFEGEEELREHIESEHRDEAKEEMKTGGWKKKHLAVKYTFTLIVILAAGVLIPQVLDEAAETDMNNSDVDLEGNPMLGGEDANTTIVFFGDYKCTTCAEVNQHLTGDIYDEFIETGQAKLYFLNYDYLNTENGESSTRAAIAGECMYRQSEEQFWSFHNNIYSEQGSQDDEWATTDYLIELAQQSTAGMNYTELESCITSEETLEHVNQDKRTGIDMNVGFVPSVFIDGEKIANTSIENIRNHLEEAVTQ